jgi:tetratricopeptide (TPR) repeat protein
MDQAISLLEDATKADPTDVVPLTTLGLLLNMKGRPQEALDSLSAAYKIAPSNEEVALSIALSHYLSRDYDRAIELLNRLLARNAKLSAAYGYLGYCYIRKGDYVKAHEMLQKLVSLKPSSHMGYSGMALAAQLSGNLEESRQNAEHAMSIEKYPPTMMILAEIDVTEGFTSGAISLANDYNRATKKGFVENPMTEIGFTRSHDFHWDPFIADSFDNGNFILARTVQLPKQASKQQSLCRQGHYDSALARAQTLSAQYPNDYFLHNEIGKMQLAAGNYGDAAEHFKKVIALAPNCHIAFFNLAYAFGLDDKTANAAAAIKQFHSLHPKVTVPEWLVKIATGTPEQPAAPGTRPLLPPLSPGANPGPQSGF